jgi:hypothetical protein
LLACIPLLSLPAFHPAHLLPEESLIRLAGEQISLSVHLYSDVWVVDPPVMVWLYAWVAAPFGQGAHFALRLFMCVYLYLTAVAFAGLVQETKPIRRFASLPALFFVWMVLVPWFQIQFSAPLVALLLALLAFASVVQIDSQPSRGRSLMFRAGLAAFAAVAVTYSAFFFVLALLAAYAQIYRARADDLLAFLGGLLAGAAVLLIWFFFTNALPDFWENSIRYPFQRFWQADSPGYIVNSRRSLQIIAYSWGLIALLALAGYAHFRTRFFNYVAKVRANETLWSTWLLFAGAYLLIHFRSLDLQKVIYITPPLAFYAAKAFDFPVAYRFRAALMLLIALLPARQYLSLLGWRMPEAFAYFKPVEGQHLMHGDLPFAEERARLLREKLAQAPDAEGIWVLSHEPQLYLLLGRPCALRYLDFRMVYYRFETMPGAGAYRGRHEEDEDIYHELTHSPPDAILDPEGLFPRLQARYPGMIHRYEAAPEIPGNVYLRKPSPGLLTQSPL